MWFAFSVLTIISWGGSDLFSKKGTLPDDKWSHLRLIIVVGTAMGLHAAGYILLTGTDYSFISMVRYLPVSLMYIGSMAIGYAGLRYIELSLSSPVCNSSGAVTALLCFLLLGQRMQSLQLLGVSLICGGILALSFLQKHYADTERAAAGREPERKYVYSAMALLFPVLYCIIDGMGSFFDAWYLENLMDEAEANLSYEFTFALCAAVSYIWMRAKKQRFSIFRERDFCLAALCETAGQFTYVYALSDNAIVAAPLISSYSIFSVLLSRIFLKEKLKGTQYAVIAVVMAGIAILGLFD